VKITTLLTQFLYTNKTLDLPGVGTFSLDPAALQDLENSKQRSATLEGVTFQYKPGLKESPALIEFISAKTGKMKALASADLASHVELAQQFLNIGKPFSLDGIGTLVKLRSGEIEFSPPIVATDRIKEYHQSDKPKHPNKEESEKNYESFLSNPRPSFSAGKPVIALVLLCGLGLAIWGGYSIATRSAEESPAPIELASAEQVLITRPSEPEPIPAATLDTAVQQPTIVSTDDKYKYVLEVAQGKRALKRYNQLRTNLWDVHLETGDSIQYKLYLMLPAMNTDTTRVLDSLTVMTGKRVYIEHQN
jgi:hypothetical protein